MNEELQEIEKLLNVYVNKYDIHDMDIIINNLWKQKIVKLVPKC